MTIAKTASRYAAAGALLLALPGCTDWAMYDVDVAQGKVPYLATMRESVRPDPNEYLRGTVEGTVPVSHPLGDIPIGYTQGQIDSVAPTLRNPVSGDDAALARGRVVYDRACAVCHGPAGAGDGQVVKQAQGENGKSYARFPFAPALNNAAAAGRSDGYIYAVVDVGRGFMPPYGERLTHMDRWAVVEYVRDLQRQGGAVPSAAVGPVTGAAAPAAAPAPQNVPAPAAAPPAGGTR